NRSLSDFLNGVDSCSGGLRPPKAFDAHIAPLQKRFGSSAFILWPLRYNQRRLNSSLTQTQPVPLKSGRNLLRTALAVTVVGALWFILLRHLSNEWSVNEQYSYGWFVPFFAAYLFWLRWQDRPAIEIRNSKFEIR